MRVAECGTVASYRYGCRCDYCRRAIAAYNRMRRRRAGVAPRHVPKHGTPWCYRRGCRRAECCEAVRQYDAERLASGAKLGPNRSHGTRATYNAGCRCPECTGAERVYRRDLRDRNRTTPIAPGWVRRRVIAEV